MIILSQEKVTRDYPRNGPWRDIDVWILVGASYKQREPARVDSFTSSPDLSAVAPNSIVVFFFLRWISLILIFSPNLLTASHATT